MHLLSRCSALGPGPGSLPRPPAFLKSKLANAAVCPVRTAFRLWSLAALHSIPGRRGYPGGEWVHPLGGLKYKARPEKIFEGNTTAFLIPRTALRGFFAVLTTHRRNFFSTLEGLLRQVALASIGLTAFPEHSPQPVLVPSWVSVQVGRGMYVGAPTGSLSLLSP
jgi:hypothetical protein